MWTASIVSTTKQNGAVYITVSFTDSIDTIVENFPVNSDIEGLKRQIASKIDDMTQAYALADSLTPGLIDTTPTLPVVNPPTPAQLAERQFAADYYLLQQMQRAVNLGVKTNTDKDFLDQLSKVKAEFSSDYLKYF